MISFERWKNGFMLTVEGRRMFSHSASSPAFFIGVPKEKRTSALAGTALKWKPLGIPVLVNESPDIITLDFAGFGVLRISFSEHILRLEFPEVVEPGVGVKLRAGANADEMLFGAGPSPDFNLKRKRVDFGARANGASGRAPVIFSSTGSWMVVDSEFPVSMNLGATRTEIACEGLPERILFGFGRNPAHGMSLLTESLGRRILHATREHAGEAEANEFETIPSLDAYATATARDFIRSILSVSFSGEGYSVWSADGDPARSGECAMFSPFFRITGRTGHSADDPGSALARNAMIFNAMWPYRKHCDELWSREGIPVLRHPSLDYSGDRKLWNLDDQYMFGPDILIAPSPGTPSRARNAYLPEDDWVHLWTSRRFGGGPVVVDAPEGKPAIFYRNSSEFRDLFDSVRQMATRL